MTGEIAIEVTGVVGVSPALWYFKVHSEHIFDSTQAPVGTGALCASLKGGNPINKHIIYKSIIGK